MVWDMLLASDDGLSEARGGEGGSPAEEAIRDKLKVIGERKRRGKIGIMLESGVEGVVSVSRVSGTGSNGLTLAGWTFWALAGHGLSREPRAKSSQARAKDSCDRPGQPSAQVRPSSQLE